MKIVEARLKEIEARAIEDGNATFGMAIDSASDVPKLLQVVRRIMLTADEFTPEDILFGLSEDIAKILGKEE